MNILQVTPTFVPSRFGGAKALSYELSKALVARGHKVTVYTTDADVGNSRLSNVRGIKSVDGIKVRYFRNLSHLLASKYNLFLSMGIISTARREIGNFDIIHLHCHRSFENIVIHHYAKKYGIPYVLDAHGSTPRMAGGKRGFKWLFKWLFDVVFGYRIVRDASRCIGETEVGVNEYKEIGVKDHDRIAMITPLRDLSEFSHLPPRGKFRLKFNLQDKRIIMFLGRIHWLKGLDFLAESFHELAKSRNDVILVIVGPDNGYKPTLGELIDRLNLSDRVLFTGFLGGEEKLSALVDADVLVQTSVYEQGAWAPYEAVLCNTPIIVSNNSGAGEDVRKMDTGYLVEYGSKNQLKDMMQYVLNNPAEVKAKTQKAKEYINANLSLESGIGKYERLYAQCIEQNKLLREREK